MSSDPDAPSTTVRRQRATDAPWHSWSSPVGLGLFLVLAASTIYVLSQASAVGM